MEGRPCPGQRLSVWFGKEAVVLTGTLRDPRRLPPHPAPAAVPPPGLRPIAPSPGTPTKPDSWLLTSPQPEPSGPGGPCLGPRAVGSLPLEEPQDLCPYLMATPAAELQGPTPGPGSHSWHPSWVLAQRAGEEGRGRRLLPGDWGLCSRKPWPCAWCVASWGSAPLPPAALCVCS